MLAFLFLTGCIIVLATIGTILVLAFICLLLSLRVSAWEAIIGFGLGTSLMLTACIMWGPAVLMWAERAYRLLLGD